MVTYTLLEFVVDKAGDGDPRHPQRLLADQAPDGGQAEVEKCGYPLLRRHFASRVMCRVALPNFWRQLRQLIDTYPTPEPDLGVRTLQRARQKLSSAVA